MGAAIITRSKPSSKHLRARSAGAAAQHQRPAVIAVIDYKAGNLTSVMKALTALGASAQVTEDPAVVRAAERVVLPGVGHFAATARLHETGIKDAVRETIDRGIPFLGICVGLQWLFEGSTESDAAPGLGAM